MGLETIEIVVWAEQEFGIEIPDPEAKHITTIGAFVAYLREKSVAAHGSEAPSEGEIFGRLAALLEQQYNVPREWIRPEVTFYKDLGLG